VLGGSAANRELGASLSFENELSLSSLQEGRSVKSKMAARGGLPSSGAWSNQVDEEAEANGGELAPPPAALPAAFPTLGGKTAFPALGESLSMKDSKKERKQKKVKQTMSLGAFVAAGRKEPEIINLPTGPRQRSEDEEDKKGALGGGFKNYGGDRGTPHQSPKAVARDQY
jgi:hypothetical protein